MTTSARFFLEIFSCSTTAVGGCFSGGATATAFSGTALADDDDDDDVLLSIGTLLLLLVEDFFAAVALGLVEAVAAERDDAEDEEEEFPFRAAALVTAALSFCRVA